MRELFEGVNLATFAAGNRRIIAAVTRATVAEPDPCGHPDHKKPSHTEHCPSHPEPKTAAPAEDTEHPFLTWAKRVGGTAAALVLLWPIVGKWMPTMAGGSLALWLIAALIAGQADPTPDKAEQAPADGANTDPAAPADGADEWIQDSPPEAVLWALIRHTAALTKQGTAAHLQAIVDEARRRGEMTDWTVSDLAEELASYGVPVVEQKKLTIGGRSVNRSAVLVAALPEADPAPVPAIVQPAASSAA